MHVPSAMCAYNFLTKCVHKKAFQRVLRKEQCSKPEACPVLARFQHRAPTFSQNPPEYLLMQATQPRAVEPSRRQFCCILRQPSSITAETLHVIPQTRLDYTISIYNALINPHFDYCSEVWDTMGVGLSNRLQNLQNRAARVIMNFSNDISGPEAIKALGWESLETRRAKCKAKTMYKVLNNLAPSSLAELFEHKRNIITKYDLRGSSTSLQLLQPKTEKLKKSL